MDRELLIGLIGMAVIGAVAYSQGLKDGTEIAVKRPKNNDPSTK